MLLVILLDNNMADTNSVTNAETSGAKVIVSKDMKRRKLLRRFRSKCVMSKCENHRP